MRTTQLRDRTTTTATGGDAAPRGLHLGGALRAAVCTDDLAAARAVGRGTLDGSITSIQVGEHGVLVRHRADRPHLTVGAP